MKYKNYDQVEKVLFIDNIESNSISYTRPQDSFFMSYWPSVHVLTSIASIANPLYIIKLLHNCNGCYATIRHFCYKSVLFICVCMYVYV